jgi:hypothetical protein
MNEQWIENVFFKQSPYINIIGLVRLEGTGHII